MLVGYLGLGAFIGAFAAVYTLMTGGSFLLALGIYSLSGALAVLLVALFAAMRDEPDEADENRLAATPAE